MRKGIIIDYEYRVGNIHRNERPAMTKCVAINAHNRRGYCHRCEERAKLECGRVNSSQGIRQCDGDEVSTLEECLVTDNSDIIGNGDVAVVIWFVKATALSNRVPCKGYNQPFQSFRWWRHLQKTNGILICPLSGLVTSWAFRD